MPTSIALSPHFEKFVHEQIDSGRYGNVSEVIRAGLRLLEEHERAMKIEQLRVAIAQGIESGEGSRRRRHLRVCGLNTNGW